MATAIQYFGLGVFVGGATVFLLVVAVFLSTKAKPVQTPQGHPVVISSHAATISHDDSSDEVVDEATGGSPRAVLQLPDSTVMHIMSRDNGHPHTYPVNVDLLEAHLSEMDVTARVSIAGGDDLACTIDGIAHAHGTFTIYLVPPAGQLFPADVLDADSTSISLSILGTPVFDTRVIMDRTRDGVAFDDVELVTNVEGAVLSVLRPQTWTPPNGGTAPNSTAARLSLHIESVVDESSYLALRFKRAGENVGFASVSGPSATPPYTLADEVSGLFGSNTTESPTNACQLLGALDRKFYSTTMTADMGNVEVDNGDRACAPGDWGAAYRAPQ